MGDLAGILILLGLAVLAVPVLLVVALLKIGKANDRIDALMRDIDALKSRLRGLEARAADGVASPATAQSSAAQQAADRPPAQAVAPPAAAVSAAFDPQRMGSAEADPGSPGRAPGLEAAAGVIASAEHPTEHPTTDASRAMPPPLPPAQRPAAIAIGSTAAYEQDRANAATGAPPMPPPRPKAPPPSDPFAPVVRWLRRWFTEGNVPVKIGMLVLFAGVAALLKYASDQGWVRVPIELRLAGVAAAAIAGLVFAWRQREQRRSFALGLQGGAIGVLMLVVFAAYKLYGLMPAGAAFAITIALVAGLGVLAVMQNTMALAVLGILAGFLAPIWLSTGSGNHVALFGYYAVLNLGIFAIAWKRPWRLLNLLGFVFTFGIGTLWGVLQYQPEKFNSTEPFLLLFFALYLLIPIFYARGRGERRRDLVDGTLVFGAPLVAFSLQAGLFEGARMPLALSALALAAIYALLATLLRGRERFLSLVDSYAVLAVGFATLSVPLALSARVTASVFALEGAALIWLGLRQRRLLPQLSGLALQALAAMAYVLGASGLNLHPVELVDQGEIGRMAIANASFMGALLIAIAAVATAWSYRRHRFGGMAGLFTVWGLGWWLFAGLQEIDRYVSSANDLKAVFAFVTVTGWFCAEARRRWSDWPVLAWTTAAALLMGSLFALWLTSQHDYPFAGWGAAAWALFALLGWRSLSTLRGAGRMQRFFAHGGWHWAWVAAIATTLMHLVDRGTFGDGWVMSSLMAPILIYAALLQLRASSLSPPLHAGFDDYRGMLLVCARIAFGALWTLSLFYPGDSKPLPWLTLVNPLELIQLGGLALLAQWAWATGPGMSTQRRVPLFALTAFVWITFATLRACHHWADTVWSPSMLDDATVQTALTVVWSVLGVLGWIFGSRRADRLLWGAGAVLMGVVLLKLVVVDRSHLGNLFGIVSFLAYGLLCTAVGYFAPAPPRRASAQESPA
ncbi:MAG: DUF2339 domain-containing protein [Lysobacteraceae bacterium]|nr:MAG: DUF2339 domain-containing protein [Xanthomonadaceae bacterium]